MLTHTTEKEDIYIYIYTMRIQREREREREIEVQKDKTNRREEDGRWGRYLLFTLEAPRAAGRYASQSLKKTNIYIYMYRYLNSV